jgi:hypothetical protein
VTKLENRWGWPGTGAAGGDDSSRSAPVACRDGRRRDTGGPCLRGLLMAQRWTVHGEVDGCDLLAERHSRRLWVEAKGHELTRPGRGHRVRAAALPRGRTGRPSGPVRRRSPGRANIGTCGASGSCRG